MKQRKIEHQNGTKLNKKDKKRNQTLNKKKN